MTRFAGVVTVAWPLQSSADMTTRTTILTILMASACGGGGQSPPDADRHQTVVELPATQNRDVDLLFMIDNSGSMADKQANLVASFPSFINALQQGGAGLPNLHLGVISSDMGTSARGNPNPAPPVGTVGNGGCAGIGDGGKLTVNGAPVTGSFLSDIGLPDGTRARNYTGTLAAVFGQMAQLGATGCGFEQPLHAIRAALDSNPANAGFLRPEAVLAVVMLTDEDDCSAADPALFGADETTLGPLQSFRCTRFGVTCATGGASPDEMNIAGPKAQCAASVSSTLLDGVSDYRDFLVGLKPDPKQVIVSAFMGTPEPVAVEPRDTNGVTQPALAHSCTGAVVADPGVRIQSLLDLFPQRSLAPTICQQDLSGGLADIGDLIASTTGSPCVPTPLADIDPGMPGIQVDCIVEDLVGGAVTPIAPCDAAETATCWKVQADPASCPSAQNLKLVVVRSSPPEPTAVTRMRCVVQ